MEIKTKNFTIIYDNDFKILGLGIIKIKINDEKCYLDLDFDCDNLSEIIKCVMDNVEAKMFLGDQRLEKCGFVLDNDYYIKFKISNTPFYIKDLKIENRVCLAPMAGICNEAYRIIVKKMGVGLVYAEMVSDKALNYLNNKTLNMLKINLLEHPISMQVFGSELDIILKAAKMIDESDCDIIDINMGCPVSKVAKKSGAGSALLKDPNKVYEIVSNVVKSVKKPVTVKIRSGWDSNSINAVEVAKLIEKAGASAIAVHPRTRSQMYSGKSDWNIIREVKKAVNIPVIGNGDIKSPLDARRMMEETGCDAVMIGRAGLGNPWLFKNIINELNNCSDRYYPSYEEIKNIIHYHTDYLTELKCEKVAILEMRSHAAWYIKGLPNATDIKKELYKCKTRDDLYNLIDNYFLDLKKEENI